MRIQRSTNKEDIKSVLHSKYAFAYTPDNEVLTDIPIHPLIHYVLIYNDADEIIGCYTLSPHNNASVDIHTNFLPSGYGELARGAIPLIFDYIFNQVGWKKVLTEIPAWNRLAHRYVKQSNMKLEGTLSSAFLKDNTLYDIFVYGMTEGEYRCQ